MKKKKEKKPLFRVFRSEDDKYAYLPSDEGLSETEAQRLSDGLAVETYIKKIYDPESEETDE